MLEARGIGKRTADRATRFVDDGSSSSSERQLGHNKLLRRADEDGLARMAPSWFNPSRSRIRQNSLVQNRLRFRSHQGAFRRRIVLRTSGEIHYTDTMITPGIPSLTYSRTFGCDRRDASSVLVLHVPRLSWRCIPALAAPGFGLTDFQRGWFRSDFSEVAAEFGRFCPRSVC